MQLAEKAGYKSVAAFEPQNVFYLTGFWGEAIAICSPWSTKLIAPKLEYTRAKEDSNDCEVVATERGTELISTFVSALEKTGKTCTDCSDYATIESIKKQLSLRPDSPSGADSAIAYDVNPLFEARKIKDEGEVRIISAASKILDRLYEICLKKIRAGVSERDLQALLVYEGMKLGANPPAYKSTLNPLIIAGGPNGALPHAEVSDRKFKKGDLVVVDLTLRHRGYISDATRTFALGSVPPEARDSYEVVRESQLAGLKAARAGTTCGAVDSACRSVISEAGASSEFIHSTGHGIGLDVHEPPWLRANNTSESLSPGMAVTVEPGIYRQGKFGIRIEDSIIVTEGKPRVLHRFPKELISL